MIPMILIGTGTLSGLVGAGLLHRRWKSPAFPRPLLLAGWIGIGYCLWAFGAAVSPDVGPAFATLGIMTAGLVLVARRSKLPELAPFPATRRAVLEKPAPPSWSGTLARTLSCLVLSPIVGLASGLLVWTLGGGHAATRFTIGVFVFLISCAVLHIWALSASKAWRTLAFILLLGGVLSALAYMRL